jgi:hypothetical protein
MRPKKTLPVLLSLVVWMLGCSSSAPGPSRTTTPVALVIRIPGGGPPSTQQTALVHAAIGPALAKAGLELATTFEEADYVITVTVVPDPADAARTHVAVSGVEQRQRKGKDALADAQSRLRELERWGESRSAPIYSP